jgi:hypothetical protein
MKYSETEIAEREKLIDEIQKLLQEIIDMK